MRPPKPINWNHIDQTCPEFIMNNWDISFGVVAAIGAVLSIILSIKFKGVVKESVYLSSLIMIEFVYCALYLWQYLFRSVAVYYKDNDMARLADSFQVKTMKEMYDICAPFILLGCIVGQFLWTCSPRTRDSWKTFTVRKYKTRVVVLIAIYSILAAVVLNWDHLKNSRFPICESTIYHAAIQKPFYQFIQLHFVPWFSVFIYAVCLIFLLLTFKRLPSVGAGPKPVSQEEGAEPAVENAPGVTSEKVKVSTICLSIVYALFLIHAIYWMVMLNPATTDITSETVHSRIVKTWIYDFGNVIFSLIRMVVYFVFCRNEAVPLSN